MRIGIGLAKDADAGAAARKAARQAREAVGRPQLVVAFAGIRLDQKKVHSALLEEFDPETLIGGSSFAEITPAGVTTDSVAVLAVELEGLGTSLASTPVDSRQYQTGIELAKRVGRPSGAGRPLGLFFSSISNGYDNDVLRAISDELGRLPIFGGLTCGDYDLGLDHPDFWKNYQYSGKELTEKGARLALLELPRGVKAGFGLEHGWEAVGPVVRVTKAQGARVFEVDGTPVLDYYRQFVGGENNAEFFKKLVQRYGFSVVSGDRSRVKVPVECDEKGGSIVYFPAEDLDGRKVQLIQCSRRGLIDGARRAAETAKAALDGAKPSLVLAVSCCTRRSILHSREQAEFEVIRDVFGPETPVFGFYSGGEIGPLSSRYDETVDGRAASGSFYNTTTITILALAAPGKLEAALPAPEAGVRDEDPRRLREKLAKSEEILDNAETFLANLSRKSYQDAEKLRRQSEVIYRYTPHDVWKRIGANAEKGSYELADAEFEGCFMFLDVKGFTAFSEEREPDQVVKALNAYFGPATDIVHECGGDVDKYIGDAMFAVFPGPDEALRAGRRLLMLFKDLKKRGAPFAVRIGMNIGRAVRANVGSRDRREYTYIGDAVNLAQRLESNCTPGKLLISKDLFEMAATPFEEVVEREIEVKGKRRPVKCFELSV